MAGDELTLRVGHTYSDRLAPLLDGTVKTDGLRLQFTTGTADELFYRTLHSDDFDVAEMSLGAHVVRTSRLEQEFVGLPVFPSRAFRHGAVYVRDGLSSPNELLGARVGTPEYLMTASIWVRQLLLEDFGIDWRKIQWFIGGLNSPGRKPRIAMRDLDQLDLSEIGDGETLSGLLEDGSLDAIIAPEVPNAFKNRNARRLFERTREVEEDWFKRTGIIPIMHLVVLRRTLAERHSDLAERLTDCFVDAEALAWRRITRNGNPSASLLWLDDDVQAEQTLLGANPFCYGLERNRGALEAFLRACEEQELVEQPVGVDDLFWPSTLAMAL